MVEAGKPTGLPAFLSAGLFMSKNKDQNLHWMRCALELARQGEGRTVPNPPVGAVVVRNGEIVGSGFHPQAGAPHAEVFALRQAGDLCRGATLYVTLEPCSHHGRTPPCADAVINAGIAAVFIGVPDPNPRVAGRGIERLKAAGISVAVGCLEEECRQLIAAFKKHILTGLPYTIYKSAMTLDGNTTAASGDSRWVSGEESRRRVHQLRHRVDAIMVGIDTVCADDPLLNTRIDGEEGHDPLRIVVDSQLRMPLNSRMLSQDSEAGTLIATISTDAAKKTELERAGAEVVVVPEMDGRVSLTELWRLLGERPIQKLLLEGGSTLATAAYRSGLIDQMLLFIAPKLLGGHGERGIFSGPPCASMAEAMTIDKQHIHFEQVGEDLLVTGEIISCSLD